MVISEVDPASIESNQSFEPVMSAILYQARYKKDGIIALDAKLQHSIIRFIGIAGLNCKE